MELREKEDLSGKSDDGEKPIDCRFQVKKGKKCSRKVRSITYLTLRLHGKLKAGTFLKAECTGTFLRFGHPHPVLLLLSDGVPVKFLR